MSERVVISHPLPGDPVGMLRDAGFDDVWMHPRDGVMARGDLLEAVRGASALVVFPGDRDVNADLFDAAGPQLKVVASYAVGTDNIDVAEAARRGIVVGNTPDPVTEPTADIAWLLLLGAARRAYQGERLVRSGDWGGVEPRQLLGQRVIGKTLLIVGAGRIGRAVARRAIGWEMKILYFARSRHPEFEEPPLSAPLVPLADGLEQADFVSVHTPLTDETRHLINEERLALMKETAVLVNTARGPVVDEAALVNALRDGRLAGAGLDVYEQEPRLAPGLAELENVFLLPHLGSATVEDREWMMRMTMENVIAGLRGEALPRPVAG